MTSSTPSTPNNDNWIMPYMRSKFNPSGRDFAEGFNCWTMTAHIYKYMAGIQIPWYDTITAEEMWEAAETIKVGKQEQTWSPISIGREKQFDVALMKTVIKLGGRLQRVVGHVGLITGPATLLHITPQWGVIHGKFRDYKGSADMRIKGKVVEVYRHVQLA